MKTKIILGLLILVAMFYSCGKIIFREVKCRDFQIKGENYWFPLVLGDSVVFANKAMSLRKKYIIVDKKIFHRTQYTSDTGCGCLDQSQMLLTSGSDSLWFVNEERYVEQNEGKYYEDIVFVVNKIKSRFNETSKTKLSNFTLNSVSFSDVEFFECKDCKAELSLKKLYRVNNIGIIYYELVNGEVWINENLLKTGNIAKDSFVYSENTCQ